MIDNSGLDVRSVGREGGGLYKQRETTKPAFNKQIITLRDDFPIWLSISLWFGYRESRVGAKIYNTWALD